jgi:hypothetical protein
MRRIAVAVAFLAACGGPDAEAPKPAFQSTRSATAAAPLLSLLPPKADAVLELDLARLRANPIVGPVLDELHKHRSTISEWSQSGLDPIQAVDVMVAASYGIGSEAPQTVFLVRGEALLADTWASHVAQASAIDAHTLAIGPHALREAVAAGPKPSLLEDVQLLRLRDVSMPKRAEGASLRLTARLDKNARIAIAGRLGVDEVPAMISAWLDVADDAALVVELETDGPAQGKRVAGAIEHLRRLGGLALPKWVGAADLLAALSTSLRDRSIKITWILGPHRFAEWTAGIRTHLMEAE